MKLTKYFLKLKTKFKKKYFLCCFFFIIILSLGIYNTYNYKSLFLEFKTDFDNYEFSKANNILLTKECYNPIKSIFLSKDLNDYFSNKVAKISDDLNNSNISDEDALVQLKEINHYSILSKNDLLCVINSVNTYTNSQNNYDNGVEYYDDFNYTEAINSLKKVSPLSLNYDDALVYINKSKAKIKENLFIFCDELAEKDYYSKAINLLTDNISVIGNDSDIQNKISELKTKQQSYYDKKSEISEASSYALTSEILPTNINTLNIESNTSYFINVNLATQKTYVYKGKADSWQLIRTCPCSTGIDSEVTPSGSFATQEKGTWFFSEKYNQGGKYWTQITGDILFHSVPYARDKKTVLDYTLDEPSSHGCIRLSLEDAKWIYSTIPKGSKIIIK